MLCERCKKKIEPLDHIWIDIDDSFSIGKYCVTNAQYKKFTDATGCNIPSHWKNGEIPKGKEDHPVVNVSYYDARMYCAWLSKELNLEIDLPTGEQWSKAAGDKVYPWGDEFIKEYCNSCENENKDTVSVDAYPDGDSPFGVSNMSGNVWEWTKEVEHDE
jgi:formylglycine-generating enzyme required for sulfatase activity